MNLTSGILTFDVLPRGFCQQVFERFQWEPKIERDLFGKPTYYILQKSGLDGGLVKKHQVTRWDYQKLCDILDSRAHPDIIP